MSDGVESTDRDVATTDDLTDRLASLRERMATLEESITGRRTVRDSVSAANGGAAGAGTIDATAPADESRTDIGDGSAEEPKPADAAQMLTPRPRPPATPAPGVDPDDPVLALGVADPDALDAWLTDEIAVVDPNATGEVEPVTAEMDATTKPSVYDTLPPGNLPPGDNQPPRWSPPPQRPRVTVEQVAHTDPVPHPPGTPRWVILLIVATVLIGMAVGVGWWLSSQPDSSAVGLLLPLL